MEICLNNQLKWARCGTIAGVKQKEAHMGWEYERSTGRLFELERRRCLAVDGEKQLVVVECCAEVSACPEQQWDLPAYQDTVEKMRALQ
jgi:hypothetical protein